MKRRILLLAIICLLFFSSLTTSLIAYEFRSISFDDNIHNSEAKDKSLAIDKIIANKHVKYIEHVVDDVYIQGDYILIHENAKGEVTKCEKIWTEIDVGQFDFSEIEVDNYFWKKKVIFPDREDHVSFYNFNYHQEYPLSCWEVRHKDGTTILYDSDENIIGKGVPAPSESFLMTGPCYNEREDKFKDEWMYLKNNAKEWYQKWSSPKKILYNPNPKNEISPNVRDHNVELFYEVAHGGDDWFSANIEKIYTATDVKNDMSDRSPMKFAFIGSCGGMDNTNKGTFSYEFRKGKMYDGVTVGYSGMAQCDGWKYAKHWQDEMFKNMDKGFTIRYSFDLACQSYPSISESVVFCGDEQMTMVVKSDNKKPNSLDLSTTESGKTHTEYSFDLVANDPDEDQLYYKINWGDGVKDLMGPYDSGEEITVIHSWKRIGRYTIKVKAIDVYGKDKESEFSISITRSSSVPQTLAKQYFPKIAILKIIFENIEEIISK